MKDRHGADPPPEDIGEEIPDPWADEAQEDWPNNPPGPLTAEGGEDGLDSRTGSE